MARVKSERRHKKVASPVLEICRRLGLPRKPFTQHELRLLLVERYGEAAPSVRTIRRWHRPNDIGPDYAQMLAEVSGWNRAQVYGDEPWPPEQGKKGLSDLLGPPSPPGEGGLGQHPADRRWWRMTEVLARVLARAVQDTLTAEAAGLPETRTRVADAIRAFALGLNSRLDLDASGLMALADVVRRGGPVDPPSIAQGVEAALKQEEVVKTPAGKNELADLIDILVVALMPLKIDVSQLGDVADLLRKGGL